SIAARVARFLRGRGARRCRSLAAALPAGTAVRATQGAVQADVVAMGLAGARPHRRARPGAAAGAAVGVRIRAGARVVPPDPRRPLASLLARSREEIPGMACRARLFPRGGTPLESGVVGIARLIGECWRRKKMLARFVFLARCGAAWRVACKSPRGAVSG